ARARAGAGWVGRGAVGAEAVKGARVPPAAATSEADGGGPWPGTDWRDHPATPDVGGQVTTAGRCDRPPPTAAADRRHTAPGATSSGVAGPARAGGQRPASAGRCA